MFLSRWFLQESDSRQEFARLEFDSCPSPTDHTIVCLIKLDRQDPPRFLVLGGIIASSYGPWRPLFDLVPFSNFGRLKLISHPDLTTELVSAKPRYMLVGTLRRHARQA